MSNEVYIHRSMTIDLLLGRVSGSGKVYATRTGPDKYIGRVEANSGKIFAARTGPDEYLGRVDLENGKVYRSILGPDEYLGRVEKDGRLYYHQPMARDMYIGKIADMTALSNGGAAFLLLALPEVEAGLAEDESNE